MTLYQFIGKYKQYYKFNANCKESEKSGGEHPCSEKTEQTGNNKFQFDDSLRKNKVTILNRSTEGVRLPSTTKKIGNYNDDLGGGTWEYTTKVVPSKDAQFEVRQFSHNGKNWYIAEPLIGNSYNDDYGDEFYINEHSANLVSDNPKDAAERAAKFFNKDRYSNTENDVPSNNNKNKTSVEKPTTTTNNKQIHEVSDKLLTNLRSGSLKQQDLIVTKELLEKQIKEYSINIAKGTQQKTALSELNSKLSSINIALHEYNSNLASNKQENNSKNKIDVKDLYPIGVSGGIPTTGSIDYHKPYKLVVYGNTYNYRSDLKSAGFSWNSNDKVWEKQVLPSEKPNGGTLDEQHKYDLGKAIQSAGRGKFASRNLKGRLVQ